MAPLQCSPHRVFTGVTLPMALAMGGLLAPIGAVQADDANSRNIAQRHLVVAIAGAINGTPAAYELPAGSTVAQAVERAGGAHDSASGRFRLFRGSLFEDSEQSLPLLDGDTLIVLSSRRFQSEHPTIVLTAPGARPLVLSIPSFDATLASIRSKLPEHLAGAVTVLNSRSMAPLDDGTIVAINQTDPNFWARMAGALPVVPYKVPEAIAVAPEPVEVTFVPAPSARVAANVPAAISRFPAPSIVQESNSPSPPKLPSIEPSVQVSSDGQPLQPDTMLALNPTPAPDRILVPVLPKLRPKTDNTETSLQNSPRPRHPRVISVEPIAVQTTTVTKTAAATREQMLRAEAANSGSQSIQPISAPSRLEIKQTIPAQPNPFDPSTSAAAIEASPSEATSNQSDSLVFVGLSAAIAFIVSGIYLVVQTRHPDPGLVSRSDDIESDSVHDITDLPVMRENAPIEMPMSIVGRTVALGHLRIDAAHEQPSGPHFARTSETRARGSRTSNAGSSISESDVFGRALAAMERERTA